MSRRYKYDRHMTAEELSRRLNALDLSAGMLSKVSGASFRRVRSWLDGEGTIPTSVQRDLDVWLIDPHALALAIAWANDYAYDVRDGEAASYRRNA